MLLLLNELLVVACLFSCKSNLYVKYPSQWIWTYVRYVSEVVSKAN